MKKSNHSITYKVIIGYLLLTAFGAATVWFVYTKVVELNKPAATKNSNKKMTLISRAATRLYTAEGFSRNIIQNKDTSALAQYNCSIDTISNILDSLKTLYNNPRTRTELDSIRYLLSLKSENIQDLLDLRRKNASHNYYDRVLKRLERADYLFGSKNYKGMVKKLKPYQQKVIIDYLKYAEKDNADRLTNRTADSLIQTMKNVLLSLEIQEHNYQENIAKKENKLLSNDLKISSRLRKIRAKIEQEEIKRSLALVESRQETLEQTSKIMIVFGTSCVITIFVFVIMIIRDTNKSKRYRQALEEAKTYAEVLLKSREQIMATVTHDLRSPLNSILGYSDLIAKTNLTAKQNKYLHQLKRSSDYTVRLVNDLLDFSRLEAGKILIEGLPFIPKKTVEDAVQGAIPSPDSKQLRIEVSLEPSLENTFISDPFRLHQILTNLISNAYKFTESGGITIRGKIIEAFEGRSLEISIQDSGVGISKKQQKMIFQEFAQVENTDGKIHKGFGLGLAISKKLCNLLHGTIKVKSELGKGSTFILIIPVKRSDKSLSDGFKTIKNIQLVHGEEKYILIVDDDQTHLRLTKEILTNQGLNITSASDGEAALEKIKTANFDAILTDVQMPKLDGYELIQEIRKSKKTRNIPVIALSGEGDKTKIDYLESGFTEYLLKPYKSSELLHLIAKVLNLKTESVSSIQTINKDFGNKPYDLTTLKQFTQDDEESLKSILESLIENTRLNLTILSEAKENSNWDKVAFIAHKMLPMLRQIKVREITVSLAKLEQQKTAELQPDQLRVLVDQILEQTEELLKKLSWEIE